MESTQVRTLADDATEAIRAAAEGIVVHWRTDIDHDERAIHAEGGRTPFLWFPRTHGTWIVFLRDPEGFGPEDDIPGNVEATRAIVEHSIRQGHRAFHWTGRTFREVCAVDAPHIVNMWAWRMLRAR